MPISQQLETYGLRQASRRLAGGRAQQYQIASERTGSKGLGEVAKSLFAKAGDVAPISTAGAATGTSGVSVGDRPELPELPKFKAPEYDESKVAAKTQKIAAPRVRQLREAVRTVQATPFENPNVKRMTISQALQGYGTGLESVMAGARRGAVAEYGQEYKGEFTEAQMNFQTDVSAQMAQYGNLWTEFLTELKGKVGGGPSPTGFGVKQDPNYKPATPLAQIPSQTTPWTGVRGL